MRNPIPFLFLFALPAHAAPPAVRASVDRARVDEGKCVVVSAEVRSGGKPAAGVMLHPYVNGRRWGAGAQTNARGRAEWPLPLPNPGAARIEVAVAPPAFRPDAAWIWAPQTRDGQSVGLQKHFRLPAKPTAAKLYITADDSFEAWVNGQLVSQGADLSRVFKVAALERWLRPGENTILVQARNAGGPAGVVAKVVAQTPKGRVEVPTDATWQVSEEMPASLPPQLGGVRTNAVAIAPIGQGPWLTTTGWPGFAPPPRYTVGMPMPSGAVRSNALTVHVSKRTFPKAPRDPHHLVGMEWEPWFTPKNIPFSTAEAIPLVGRYDSFNKDGIRQHGLWLADIGVDFILVDWTNNLWDKKTFVERSPATDELIAATTTMLDVFAAMRDEGIPVPRVALLPGLNNGPSTTTTAINEQNQWVAKHYLDNPRYHDLWVTHEGKPLVVVFNGGGPAMLKGQPPIDRSRFTVRWMASQLQGNEHDPAGYWSWMDGKLYPVPVYRDAKAEAMTVTPAFFGYGGWTYPQAMARRGGATFAAQFGYADAIRPKFLLINQWNEFAGQPNGGGYGEKHDQYVDCYSVPFSNDIEPTATNRRGYRGDLGYGFFYMNLTRALIACYHGENTRDTILTVAAPERNATVTGETLSVEWHFLGVPPASYTVELDGRAVRKNAREKKTTVSVKGLKPGPHVLTVRANGATTHYPLSTTRDDTRLEKPAPVAVSVPLIIDYRGYFGSALVSPQIFLRPLRTWQITEFQRL